MDLKELYKVQSDFQSLVGYATAFEQRQSFALEHFSSVLSYAISLGNDIENRNSEKRKHSIADNYPAGYSEPVCAIKGSCDLVNEQKDVIEQLFNACVYALALLRDNIGQTTHAIAFLEQAKAKKEQVG